MTVVLAVTKQLQCSYKELQQSQLRSTACACARPCGSVRHHMAVAGRGLGLLHVTSPQGHAGGKGSIEVTFFRYLYNVTIETTIAECMKTEQMLWKHMPGVDSLAD